MSEPNYRQHDLAEWLAALRRQPMSDSDRRRITEWIDTIASVDTLEARVASLEYRMDTAAAMLTPPGHPLYDYLGVSWRDKQARTMPKPSTPAQVAALRRMGLEPRDEHAGTATPVKGGIGDETDEQVHSALAGTGGITPPNPTDDEPTE